MDNKYKEDLLKAIELAQNPGKCEYFVDGKPMCVMGQLAAINGAKEKDFLFVKEQCIENILLCDNAAKQYFENYPDGLLSSLQVNWDCTDKDEEETKKILVDLVNSY
jgi:hypothetical protein